MRSRRDMLLGAGALLAGAGVPRVARAESLGERRFVFVVASGGWDPTRALQPAFDVPGASLEPGAERVRLGDLSFVDHPSRPAVRGFFARWAPQALVLNGLLVRSIAHDPCRRILLTGGPAGDTPDWPAILAAEARESYVLPHVVLGGPNYAGDRAAFVARTGAYGQLAELLGDDALAGLDLPVTPLPAPADDLVERFLARRGPAYVAERVGTPGEGLARAWDQARGRARDLADLQATVDLGRAADVAGKIDVACELLSAGVARCVTMDTGAGSLYWDTHTENDARQGPLWEGLFANLAQLMEGLAQRPGVNAATLLEETTVVVLSEMGRSPVLNGSRGKDHWPTTSALLLGAGVSGGRVLGGVDTRFAGISVDPVTGAPDGAGVVPTASTLGASLLAMGDVDPEPWTDAPPLTLG